MLKQLEEMTRLVRALTNESSGNLPQPSVPAFLIQYGYARRNPETGKIFISRTRLVDDICNGILRGREGIGRSTYISIIKWLLENPA